MPKLNSIELKHKRKILNWAGTNWHKLKESSKVRIWCAMYDKAEPSKMQIEGEIDHFFGQSAAELDQVEAEILGSSSKRFETSAN